MITNMTRYFVLIWKRSHILGIQIEPSLLANSDDVPRIELCVLISLGKTIRHLILSSNASYIHNSTFETYGMAKRL